MLTTHEVAKKLLEGPDVPLVMTLGSVHGKPEYVSVDFLTDRVFEAQACVTESGLALEGHEGQPGFRIRWVDVIVLKLEPAAHSPRKFTVAIETDT